MPQSIVMRTGTRDELGGVDVGFVNVYERPERAGRLSVMLVLPDSDVILCVGDAVDIGSSRFTLEALTPHNGAYRVELQQLLPEPVEPPPPATNLPIPAVEVHRLKVILKQLTPRILLSLSGSEPAPALSGWVSETHDTMHKEWNGGEIGPNTEQRNVASFTGAGDRRVEASITLDTIRYVQDEVYRREISAYWRCGEADAHIFLRSEGEAKMDHIVGDRLDPAILSLIRAAILAG